MNINWFDCLVIKALDTLFIPYSDRVEICGLLERRDIILKEMVEIFNETARVVYGVTERTEPKRARLCFRTEF